MTLSDELALLSLDIERAGSDPALVVLCRDTFRALLLRYERETEAVYQAFDPTVLEEARDVFEEQIARDLVDGVVRLGVVR